MDVTKPCEFIGFGAREHPGRTVVDLWGLSGPSPTAKPSGKGGGLRPPNNKSTVFGPEALLRNLTE
jgi:hypothetical protein